MEKNKRRNRSYENTESDVNDWCMSTTEDANESRKDTKKIKTRWEAEMEEDLRKEGMRTKWKVIENIRKTQFLCKIKIHLF